MGQQESKQKTDQIITSLNRMRKDMRNGKITANDVERVQEILQKYSNEIDGQRSNRSKSIYTIDQLIEITSKELDALKQEVNLDQGAVSTNSFSRYSSKNSSKRKSIKSIIDSVQDIRQQIRSGKLKQENFEKLQRDLVNYSQLINEKKNKKSEADAAQKLISSVTQELFTKQQDGSESGTRRSSVSSLKKDRASVSEKRVSLKTPEARKEVPKLTSRNSTSTLENIEQKLEALKSDVKVAETNKDKSRLHFLLKSIQTLMTDLQLVNVTDDILKEQKKELLEKNLQRVYQQIEKIKRQITHENDLKYLQNLQMKEQKEKYLDDLEDIHQKLIEIGGTLNIQNFQQLKEMFNLLKNKVNSFQEIDEEVQLKKSEVSDVMFNVENAFTRIEMEERLNQAEWRHFQYKLDLNNFSETTESDVYKKYKLYLEQLKEYVGKILEISNKIDEKKKYVLYNIDNNIIALDKKAEENKEKSQLEKVELRRNVKKDKIVSLLNTAREIQTDYTTEESQEILPLLIEAKSIIDKKLSLLKNEKNPDEPDIYLVTVKEKQVESPLLNTVFPFRMNLDNIQKDVETLQVQIENSRYTKETQLYKDMKNKLESYKREVSYWNEDGTKSKENLLKYIDNVLLLLENNLSSRKSTTEDLLIDIMSVSTRVNELGAKIQNFSHTIQDYDSIKNNLQEHKLYLKNLKIVSNRANLSKARDDIVQQIDRYLNNLEDIKQNSNTTISEEEKRFNQDLRKLKEKVYRYSGTYKNVLYKTIENDLEKYSKKVDTVFKDTNIALKVKQDIENTKMILEQKSTKDSYYDTIKQELKESGSKELTEIRENVDSVKQQLTQIAPLSKEELNKLDARLTLSILALDNIKDENCSEEKEKLYQEIHLYFQKIQEMMLMAKSNLILVDDYNQQQDEEQTQAATLARIEQELELVKPQILTFVGTETSSNFLQLDEVLVRGTLELDQMNLDQTSKLYQAKVKLMRELQKYCDILDERMNQTEQMELLERNARIVLLKIDSFNGYFGDAEYTHLDEEIIQLKISLGKLQVNQELVARKEACIKEIDSCMRKLNEAAKSRTTLLAGTLV